MVKRHVAGKKLLGLQHCRETSINSSHPVRTGGINPDHPSYGADLTILGQCSHRTAFALIQVRTKLPPELLGSKAEARVVPTVGESMAKGRDEGGVCVAYQ